ncbi:MAG: tetratricopeptide repeat protein [Bacteroidia bacterium]
MKKILSLLLIVFAFNSYSFSQDTYTVDSFQTQLKNHYARKLEFGKNVPPMYDTVAAWILNDLAYQYTYNNPDTAMVLARQSLAIAEELEWKRGKANAWSSMGLIKSNTGDYAMAIEFFKKAIAIRIEMGNRKGVAWAYQQTGSAYENQGNYVEALKNYFDALRINEQIGNKAAQANNLAAIANIHMRQNNYPDALKYLSASLKIYEELGEKVGMANVYVNMGIVNRLKNNYAEALKYLLSALKIYGESGDKFNVANSYNEIGIVYMKQGNYPEALKYLQDALKTEVEVDDKIGMGYSYNNIGEIYMLEKKYAESAEYFNKSMAIANITGNIDAISSLHGSLVAVDSAQGNFKQALEHYKLYISFRDSLWSTDNTKKLTQQQMQYDFDKKETLTKAENEKELQKQKLLRNGFMGGFAVVLLFAGIFFRQRNKTKKEKVRAEEEMKRSDELLLNILPGEVAEEIKYTGTVKAKAFTMVTVMLTDFKDFTSVSEKISAELLVDEIHTCFSAFDHILHKYGIEKIKTIGDAYLCASGLPVSNYTHAVDMMNAAFEIRSFMAQRKKEKQLRGEIPFDLRIGIHTGPVVAGVVGVKKFAYDIWGDTVNIVARMEQNSEAGKINISGATYELVKDKFNCFHRGKIQAKNKGEIDMYFVETLS